MLDWIPAQKRTVVGEVVESDPPGVGSGHRTAVSFLVWVRSYGYGHVSRRGHTGRVYMQATLCSVLFLQLCLKSKITSK